MFIVFLVHSFKHKLHPRTSRLLKQSPSKLVTMAAGDPAEELVDYEEEEVAEAEAGKGAEVRNDGAAT